MCGCLFLLLAAVPDVYPVQREAEDSDGRGDLESQGEPKDVEHSQRSQRSLLSHRQVKHQPTGFPLSLTHTQKFGATWDNDYFVD